MKFCIHLVVYVFLAVSTFSVTDALAAGNDREALQKKFSSPLMEFFDFTNERRGMLPMGLLDQDNKPVSLNDYKGKFLIVHFWATWCSLCIVEMPKVKQFKEKKEGKNLAVVLISLDYAMTPERISQIMKRNDIENLPTLHIPAKDPSWAELEDFALPATFLISPKGQVLYKFLGPNEWMSPDSLAFIDYLVENQKN
jgi:thiol-disulfide isomerase/thioredoxin